MDIYHVETLRSWLGEDQKGMTPCGILKSDSFGALPRALQGAYG